MSNEAADPKASENLPAKENSEWNGAEYLRKKHLVTPAGGYNKSWNGIRSPITGKVCDPTNRDIGQVFPFLMKEALQASVQLGSKSQEELVALDTIGQFMAKIWNESLQNNESGLCQFRALYERMREIPGGDEAYTAFCSFFVQTFFCYMFTVQKLSNGLPDGIDQEDVQDYQSMITCLSVLDDDLKRRVLQQWLERGRWPSNITYGKFLRRLEDFVEVVKEGQRLRLEEEEKIKQQKVSA
jgi:hypothetical protein